MYEIPIEPLPERIARLSDEARTKGIRFGPPLPLAELTALEARYGMMLPEDYRDFILSVGNGTLRRSRYRWVPFAASLSKGRGAAQPRSTLQNIKKKFPFTHCWDWKLDGKLYTASRAQSHHGQILLSAQGPHKRSILVVTGRVRGTVWEVGRHYITPTMPPRDFLQWLEDWMDLDRF